MIGLVLGYICTTALSRSQEVCWGIFVLLTCLHQYANYRLVRVLVLDTLNPQRLFLIVQHAEDNLRSQGRNGEAMRSPSKPSLQNMSQSGVETQEGRCQLSLPSPAMVAQIESIYRPLWYSQIVFLS